MMDENIACMIVRGFHVCSDFWRAPTKVQLIAFAQKVLIFWNHNILYNDNVGNILCDPSFISSAELWRRVKLARNDSPSLMTCDIFRRCVPCALHCGCAGCLVDLFLLGIALVSLLMIACVRFSTLVSFQKHTCFFSETHLFLFQCFFSLVSFHLFLFRKHVFKLIQPFVRHTLADKECSCLLVNVVGRDCSFLYVS